MIYFKILFSQLYFSACNIQNNSYDDVHNEKSLKIALLKTFFMIDHRQFSLKCINKYMLNKMQHWLCIQGCKCQNTKHTNKLANKI